MAASFVPISAGGDSGSSLRATATSPSPDLGSGSGSSGRSTAEYHLGVHSIGHLGVNSIFHEQICSKQWKFIGSTTPRQGGKRLIPVGLGDDDQCIEDDFTA